MRARKCTPLLADFVVRRMLHQRQGTQAGARETKDVLLVDGGAALSLHHFLYIVVVRVPLYTFLTTFGN